MAMQGNWNMGMEEISSADTLKATFAEFLATAVFVFIGVGSIVAYLASQGAEGLIIVAFAQGFAIALLIAGIGAVSGGHINPAVTFAYVITGRISVARGVMYVIAQLAGAAVGMLLLRAFLIDSIVDASGPGGIINDSVVPSTMAAVGLEATGTFILVWTVFAVALAPRGNSGIIAPLFIGLAYLAIELVLFPLTGAGINPARTFGPALVNNDWTDQWVYWVGPLIGAAIAGISYYILFLMDDAGTSSSTA